MSQDNISWNIIHKYFEEDNYRLTQHHLQSYSDLVRHKIPKVIENFNSTNYSLNYYNESKFLEQNKFLLLFVGLNENDTRKYLSSNKKESLFPSRMYINHQMMSKKEINKKTGKVELKQRLITPNEARLQNLTYQIQIGADITIVYLDQNRNNWQLPKKEYFMDELRERLNQPMNSYIIFKTFKNVPITKLPLMLHSEFCILRDMDSEILKELGECSYERGGYFIINGKEKVIINQEGYLRNTIIIKRTALPATATSVIPKTHINWQGHFNNDKEEFYQAYISCKNETAPPSAVKIFFQREYSEGTMNSNGGYSSNKFKLFKGLYVTIVDSDNRPIVEMIPLFTLFRAFGLQSDMEILEAIFGYDMSKVVSENIPTNKKYFPKLNTKNKELYFEKGNRVLCYVNGDANCIWLEFSEDNNFTINDIIDIPKGLNISSEANIKYISPDNKLCKVEIINENFDIEDNISIDYVEYHGKKLKILNCCSNNLAEKQMVTVNELNKDSVNISFKKCSKKDTIHDPILYEYLIPSINEGSLSYNTNISRIILRQYAEKSKHSSKAYTPKEILRDQTFPHIRLHKREESNYEKDKNGDTIEEQKLFHRKILLLGYMTKKLIYAYIGLHDRETSKDSYSVRRILLSGEMILNDLFRAFYKQMYNKYHEYIRIGAEIAKNTFEDMITETTIRHKIFDEMYMTKNIANGFIGIWGMGEDKDSTGYCQELIRLSFLGSFSYLRRINKDLPSTSSSGKKTTSKAVKPRMIHSSQWGMVCPVETPDGGKIGKTKHLTMFAYISPHLEENELDILYSFLNKYSIDVFDLKNFSLLESYHKILIDGDLNYVSPINKIENILSPDLLVEMLRLYRRNGLISPFISISWNIKNKEILINTQEGRLMRPLLITKNNMLKFSKHENDNVSWTWADLLSGKSNTSNTKTSGMYHKLSNKYNINQKLGNHFNDNSFDKTHFELMLRAGVIEYVDSLESETILVATRLSQLIDKELFFYYLFNLFLSNKSLTIGKIKEMVCFSTTKKETEFLKKDDCDIQSPIISSCQIYNLEKLENYISNIKKEWFQKLSKKEKEKEIQNIKCVDFNNILYYNISRLYSVIVENQNNEYLTLIKENSNNRGEIQHYTHCELHPSMLMGMMGMIVPFAENNPGPRNLYACHHSKQALGLYVSNFRKRMDHANHILNYGQRPLASSRYLKYITKERLSYGINVMVAVMTYGGFNIEDSILVNKNSVKRGMFHSSYYFTEEVREKREKRDSLTIENHNKLKKNIKYNYELLDNNKNIINSKFRNKRIKKDDVLIRGYSQSMMNSENVVDESRVAKADGYVDQIYLSSNVKGKRVAKVTLRDVRIPDTGDKFASRHGQKGTVGNLVPEEDMPFISFGTDEKFSYLNGVKPDIILNPHALPTRMTIGQLKEMLSCILGCKYGVGIEATPLCNTLEDAIENISKYLRKIGFEQSGNHVMYNGITGEQFKTSIFLAPCYYQRLKHMPKDKMYYRRQGKSDAITRQPVGGRAQGGGLKIGEMEKDSLVAHGISTTIKESFYERSDSYSYKIDNKEGEIYAPKVQDKIDYEEWLPVYENLNSVSLNEGHNFYINKKNGGEKVKNETIIRDSKNNSMETTEVNIPYSTKLMSQEFNTMGIGFKLRTSKTEPIEYKTLNKDFIPEVTPPDQSEINLEND